METTIEKKQKSPQDIKLEVLTYLQKTSKHLFLTDDGTYLKVMPICVDEKWYAVSIEFNENRVKLWFFSVDRIISNYGNNSKCVISHLLFPPHEKRMSVRQTKEIKDKMFEVYKYISSNFNGSNKSEIQEKVAKMLKDIT